MKANSHFEQGVQRQKDKLYPLAEVSYSKAIEEDPNNAEIYSLRGVVRFHLNRTIEALADMNQSVMLDPEYSYRYSSRAYIKEALGDTLGAIADYEKCVELDPEDAIAFNNLGLLQEKLGRQKQANVSFTKAEDLSSVLKERGIVLQAPESGTPEKRKNATIEKSTPNSESGSNRMKKDSPSLVSIILSTVTSRQGFQEFVAFISNGFRIKE